MVVSMDSKKGCMNVAYSKKRIFDQMASMHFRLSDEYKRLASIEDAIEIIISVALCGITFLDYQEYFNITIQRTLFRGFDWMKLSALCQVDDILARTT